METLTPPAATGGHADPPRARAAPEDSWGWELPGRPGVRIALVLGAVAAAFDVAVHAGLDSFAGVALVAVASLALVVSGRLANRRCLVLLVAAVLVATGAALREAPWLVGLDLGVAALLVAVAASYGGGGRLAGSGVHEVGFRSARALISGVLAPGFVLQAGGSLAPPPGADGRRRLTALLRGAGIAAPVVVAVALLLASADAMFARVFRVPFGIDTAADHAAVFAVGLLLAGAALVEVSQPELHRVARSRRSLGTIEAGVVVGSLAALYALFAAVQVAVASGGDAYVQETIGLTYAEHARQGFFQLLAVAGLTLAVLLGVRPTLRLAGGARRWLVPLAEAVVVLTLVIVGVALARLSLYEQVFGLTLLRLGAVAAAWWLGAVFVLVGVALAIDRGAVHGAGAPDPRERGAAWLGAAIAVSMIGAIVVVTVSDPEAVIVRRNVERYERVGSLDTAYLAGLSDDAVPELVAALRGLDPATARDVRASVCGRRRSDEAAGVARNLAVERAEQARAEVCPP